MNRVELRVCIGLGLRVVLGGPLRLSDKDDKKGGVESTLFHLWQVNLAFATQTWIDIGSREVEWDVIVAVDRHHTLMNRHRFRNQCGLGDRGFLGGRHTVTPAPTAGRHDPQDKKKHRVDVTVSGYLHLHRSGAGERRNSSVPST